jgi:UDP-N-acetylmuramoyl-L-alanyl-D-glutamate--2,6-diaminopimelate ligase
MLNRLKNIVRSIIPEPLIIGYHLAWAKLGASLYRHPSEKLYVIGITGTKGKTSTANFVWSVLRQSGIKAGLIGTANIKIGDKESLNEYHMTMPGRFVIQKLLRQMAKADCTHVVMEATSEGIKLQRHKGIIFDCAIFTNLTPEHLPSHGGNFEKYKKTKGELFASLMQHAKQLNGKYVKRISIINHDDDNAIFFENFPADIKKTYSIKNISDFQAVNIQDSGDGVRFHVNNIGNKLSVLGAFNVYNALPAIALGNILGLSQEHITQGLLDLRLIPGRMEQIAEGQDFKVIVDYAHEKISMNALLDTARSMAGPNNVIVLLGAEGGGRDKAKRADMGEAAARKANFVICSNVDPYEDDPKEIIEDIAKVAEKFGKIRNESLFVIEDRRAGIAKALALAKANDMVLFTGKGAEQSMIIGGKSIPWDDRVVVREELRKLMRVKFSQPK